MLRGGNLASWHVGDGDGLLEVGRGVGDGDGLFVGLGSQHLLVNSFGIGSGMVQR
jgi:hypothetical protein